MTKAEILSIALVDYRRTAKIAEALAPAAAAGDAQAAALIRRANNLLSRLGSAIEQLEQFSTTPTTNH